MIVYLFGSYFASICLINFLVWAFGEKDLSVTFFFGELKPSEPLPDDLKGDSEYPLPEAVVALDPLEPGEVIVFLFAGLE